MLVALQYFCILVSSSDFYNSSQEEIADLRPADNNQGQFSFITGIPIKRKKNTQLLPQNYNRKVIYSGLPVSSPLDKFDRFQNVLQNPQKYKTKHAQSFDPSSEYRPDYYVNSHDVPLLENSYCDRHMINRDSSIEFYPYVNEQSTFIQRLNFPTSSMNNIGMNSQDNSSFVSVNDSISNVSSKKTDDSLLNKETQKEIEERLIEQIMEKLKKQYVLVKIELQKEYEEILIGQIMEKLKKRYVLVKRGSIKEVLFNKILKDYLANGDNTSDGLYAKEDSKTKTSSVFTDQKIAKSEILETKGKISCQIQEHSNNQTPKSQGLQSSSKNTFEANENVNMAIDSELNYEFIANKETIQYNVEDSKQLTKINLNSNVNTKNLLTQQTSVLVLKEINLPVPKQELEITSDPNTTKVVEKPSKPFTTQVVENTSISADINDKSKNPRTPQPIRKQTVSKADIEREEQKSKTIKEIYSTKAKVAAAPEVAFIKKEEPKEEPTIEIERKKVTPKNKPAKKSGKKPATKSVASVSASNINLSTESNNNISDETAMKVETTIIDEENRDSLNKDKQDTDKASGLDLKVYSESGLHQTVNLESLDKTELAPEKTSNSDSKKFEEIISIKEERIESLEENNQNLKIISEVNAVEPKDSTSTIEEKVESCDQKINTETKQQKLTEDINSTFSEESKPESQKNTKKGKKYINDSNINPPTSEKQADLGNEDTKSETTSKNKSKEPEIKQDSGKTSKKAKSKDPELSKNELGAIPKQPTSKQQTKSSKKFKTKKSSKNEDDEYFQRVIDEFGYKNPQEKSVKAKESSNSNYDKGRRVFLLQDVAYLKKKLGRIS